MKISTCGKSNETEQEGTAQKKNRRSHEIFKKLYGIFADVLITVLRFSVYFENSGNRTAFEKVKSFQTVADLTDWTANQQERLMHINAASFLVDKLIVGWILLRWPKKTPARIIHQSWLTFDHIGDLLDPTVSRSVVKLTFIQVRYNSLKSIQALDQMSNKQLHFFIQLWLENLWNLGGKTVRERQH